MAQVVNASQVKLNDGKIVQAQQGGWYDGQQFWGGSLSNPGQINAQSNQVGAGQNVSNEVIAQTSPANVAYIQQQRQQAQPQPQPTPQPLPAQASSTAMSGNSSKVAGGGLGITPPPAIDLPKLYESLYASSGIRNTEAELNAKTMAYNDQVAKIKDNPYLSEARMTGRINKLDQKFAADTAALKNDIAMRKADVETQLSLQTKQFDINNDQAKRAFEQFTSLLSAGALNDVSGEDIANLTRTTGISSSMIQSAIEANKAKNVKTEMIKYDDGDNQGFAIVNSNTGQIINKQVIAASKPTTTEEKQALGGGTTKAPTAQQLKTDAGTAAKAGKTYPDLLKFFVSQGLSPKDVYNIYTSTNYYKRPPDNVNPKTGLYIQ